MEEQKKNPAQGLSESEQVQVRRQKLADLQAAGNDPFTLTKFPQDAYSADLKEEFKELPNETDSGKTVALAGRMMSKRVMGKASFAHLRDDKGDIQLYVRRDELGEEPYAAFKKLDVGDIIGVKGEVFRTKTGELSVRATELTLLAKSLRPLPEKFHGLTDTEMRYRQRYVDLIANPEVKDTFVKRSQILKEIRAYLDEKGFLEVDTPILTPFEIGASARPFYTHHNSLNMDMVLRIETELYLKRLIVGGMDRVYEVGRIFRNEGMDPKHNPEFTTVELYEAYADFNDMMDLFEDLLTSSAQKLLGTYQLEWQGEQIDLTPGWPRLPMHEAVKQYTGLDFMAITSDEEAVAAAKSIGVELPDTREELEAALRNILKYGDRIVVEEKIHGTEVTVPVLGDRCLSPIEIVPPEGSTFDYVAKYQSGDEGAREICPARISERDRQTVCEAALKFHNALGLSVYSRTDFIIDSEGRAWCLEVNTLPGMTPNSLIPKAAKLEGLEYPQLCEEIIRLSLECKSKK